MKVVLLFFAAVAAMSLGFSCAATSSAPPREYVPYETWYDSAAGVKCYTLNGYHGISCVKVR